MPKLITLNDSPNYFDPNCVKSIAYDPEWEAIIINDYDNETLAFIPVIVCEHCREHPDFDLEEHICELTGLIADYINDSVAGETDACCQAEYEMERFDFASEKPEQADVTSPQPPEEKAVES